MDGPQGKLQQKLWHTFVIIQIDFCYVMYCECTAAVANENLNSILFVVLYTLYQLLHYFC